MTPPRHVLIGGLQRSGTTLLARILAQHSDVSAFSDTGFVQDEGQYLQSVFPTSYAHGGPGRFAFDPAAHFTETSPLLTEENKSTLQREWGSYWNLEKPVLVEKSPSHILKSRFLNEVFPDSYFIFMTRHPVAVSIATQKWSGTSIFSLIDHWLVAHEILREDLKFLKRYAIIPYERLAHDPEPIIRNLEKALSVKKSPYKFQLDRRANDNYFKLWNENFHPQVSRDIPILNKGKVASPPGAKPLSSRAMRYLVPVPRQTSRHFTTPSHMLLTNPLFESQDAIARFGARIKTFGYSLEDFSLCPRMVAK